MTGVQESLKKSIKGTNYNATSRDKVNKARKIAKHLAAVKDKKDNPPKTPRGTARKLTRTGVLPRAERKGYIQHAKPTDNASTGA